jgi:hypothetical protein
MKTADFIVETDNQSGVTSVECKDYDECQLYLLIHKVDNL